MTSSAHGLRRSLLTLLVVAGAAGCARAPAGVPRYEGPIIDMHLHAEADLWAPRRLCFPEPCDSEPTTVSDVAELRTRTLELMRDNRIVLGVVSGFKEDVLPWIDAGGPELLAGIQAPSRIPIDTVRALLESGRIQVLGEMTAQYYGVPIDDPSLDPLFGLAREFDVPVHVHVEGLGAGDFPSHLGNPLRLVPVLKRHPGLRLYLENAGWPFLDETTSLMYQHPSVYADISTILDVIPREVALSFVEELIERGLGQRLMFGSDQMIWPEVIDSSIETLQSADFLSLEQKADLFYNNAARFLRLDSTRIAAHHRR